LIDIPRIAAGSGRIFIGFEAPDKLDRRSSKRSIPILIVVNLP
jgi:hypothetical protein